MATVSKQIKFLFLFLIVAFLAACRTQVVEQPLDEVTVQLAWQHQAQFSGLYAADQLGYYAEEGLKVTLLPRAGSEVDIVNPVVAGTADFGVSAAVGLITARAEGNPVRAIATIYRRNPLVFMTLASSGINSPHDFPGHTMRKQGGPGAMAFSAMMTRLDLDPDSVQKIDSGFDPSPFFASEVDIWPGYLIDVVLEANNRDYEVNLIFPDDYGIHLYGDTLFTTNQLIEENPDLVTRFLRTTLHGWQWAIENPAEVGPMALKYAPPLDEAQQVAMMEASVPLIHTGEDQIGWMREEVWQGMHDMLLEQGILQEPVELDRVYTMTFLEAVYGGE